MRHLIAALLGVTALTAAAQVASAADVATRAPARSVVMAPVPGFNWTGFYIGIHGGYGSGDANASLGGLSASSDIDGWFGGGQFGYNWQAYGSPWLLGLEVDAAFGSIDASVSAVSGAASATASSDIDHLGSARVRVGYAWDRSLVYVTTGVGWAGNEVAASASIPGFTAAISDNQTHVGWTVGGGFEFAFAPQWSVKLEYLYFDLGNENYFANIGGGFNGDLEVHTFKVGLNYLFNVGKGRPY